MIALDASALLAFLFREPGAEAVAGVIDGSCLSTVNLAEVVSRFVRDGHNAQMVRDRLVASPIEIVPFSSDEAVAAADLVRWTRLLGLSLGDRACLALGALRSIPVMTADRAWERLECDVEIRIIR